MGFIIAGFILVLIMLYLLLSALWSIKALAEQQVTKLEKTVELLYKLNNQYNEKR